MINYKLIAKAENKIKGIPYKQLYNYSRFNSPINQKLSEGILKRRSRDYSKHHIKGNTCQKCSSKENIERHHINYRQPNDVIFLCKKCHRKIHRKVK